MSAKMILRTACGLVITLVILTLVVSTVQAEAPANDNFADAKIISGTPYDDSLETYEATVELGEPTPDCWINWPYPGDLNYHTVWYAFTPTANGSVQGYIDRNFNAGLAVYTGSDLANLTAIGCWRQVWDYRFNVQAGVTYYLQIGGLTGQSGWMNLFLNFKLPPPNDNFADATLISDTPFEDELNTSEATIEPSEPRPSCSWTPGQTIWYAYTPAITGLAEVRIIPDYGSFLSVYTGNDLSSLTEIGCWDFLGDATFQVEAGQTYFLQIGSMSGEAGGVRFKLEFVPPPSNDNFGDALEITLGASNRFYNSMATMEPGEPTPSCYSQISQTVWFRYTPTADGFATIQSDAYWIRVVGVYTGSELGDLTEVNCRSWWDAPLPLHVVSGTTYYFQVGSRHNFESGWFTFMLYETPLPGADFWWGTGDPNIYDLVQFCDNSFDPVWAGFTNHWWEFGDGTTGTDNCIFHQFAADEDYVVWHNIQTSDGRTDPDGVTHTLSVRTHDVTAVRVAAPKSASVGQTRPITVYIKNIRYPERVEVQLYKSVPGGYEMVGVTNQNIPVRLGNRTTAVSFSYTFTQADADMGKVTFKAVVNIIDARDALPGDNEAISPPAKITQ